jgi:hypothetical protein
MGWSTRFQNNDPSYLEPRISNAETSLAQSASDILQRAINVKNPPTPLVACKGDGSTNDAPALQAIINYVSTNTAKTIYFPTGVYILNSTIQVNTTNITLIGAGRTLYDGDVGGTIFHWMGSGAMFQLDTDDGNAWDSSEYNGKGEGFTLSDMSFICFKFDTPLSNGSVNYGAGTYLVRDWRGGSVNYNKIYVANFDYAFWGIQSDVNRFTDVIMKKCHSGFYLGARSDQAVFDGLWTGQCDQVLWIDGAWGTRILNGQFDSDGSTSVIPIRIGSQWVRGTDGTQFINCWFEGYGYSSAWTLESWVQIGVTDSYPVTNTIFDNPKMLTNATQGTGGGEHVQYFIKVGANADKVTINNPTGTPTNLNSVVEFTGVSNANVYIHMHLNDRPSTLWVNNGTGTPAVYEWDYGQQNLTAYVPNGRFYIRNSPKIANQDFYINSNASKQFSVFFPDTGDGNTQRLNFQRRYIAGSAAPTTNTWDQGDYVMNNFPTEQGTAGSKYIVRGWMCTVAGTPGTWVQDRGLTGN